MTILSRIITDDKVDSTITETSVNPVSSSSVYAALGGKIDTDQGAENAGRIMKVGTSGSVVLAVPPQVNGVTLNGDKSSEDLEIVENLTKVEYDALSDTEKMSGKLFCTTDETSSIPYSQLSGKPSVNGVTLSGNKTSEDLNIAVNLTKAEYEALSEEEKMSGKLFCTTDE